MFCTVSDPPPPRQATVSRAVGGGGNTELFGWPGYLHLTRCSHHEAFIGPTRDMLAAQMIDYPTSNKDIILAKGSPVMSVSTVEPSESLNILLGHPNAVRVGTVQCF
jgi:hypothetical protein